ncbi:MAG: hypothetical protein CfP315_0859 [Candidatus Improbicoccus pseudotrichonymphae]|uniref:Chromosome segregation ATPase n=1 Tax=Candidatus Improbicoccus pseudotrichonymphae TaxID=3033792 RepID=A0AA48L154_9FIRM|nr:MAG: hypothetical protein CfP315_0859 [Candidatus Improbicoccus pseudotrichonymphae]
MIVKKYLATFLSLFYMNVAFAKVTALGENQPEKTTLEDGNTFEEEEKLEEKEELEKPKDDKSKKLNPESKESAKDLLYGFLSGTAIGSVVTAVGSYAFNKSRATGVYEKGVSEKLEELVKKCKSAIGKDCEYSTICKDHKDYEDNLLNKLEEIVDSLVSKMAEASEESKELKASKIQLEQELNSCKSKIQELENNLKSFDSSLKKNQELEEEKNRLMEKIQEKDKESGVLGAQLFNLENESRNLKAEIEKLNDSLLADQHGEGSDAFSTLLKEKMKLEEENDELNRGDKLIINLQKEKNELEKGTNELITNLRREIGLPDGAVNDLLQKLSSIKLNMINPLDSNDGLDKKSLDELSNNLVSKGREELNALETKLFELGQNLKTSKGKVESLNNELKKRGTSGTVPALEENTRLKEENRLEENRLEENRLKKRVLEAIIENFRKEIELPGGQSDNDFIQELLSIEEKSNSLLVTIRGDTKFTSNTGTSELQLAKESIKNGLKGIESDTKSLYGKTYANCYTGEPSFFDDAPEQITYKEESTLEFSSEKNSLCDYLKLFRQMFVDLIKRIGRSHKLYYDKCYDFNNLSTNLNAQVSSHANTIIAMNRNFERRMAITKLYYTQADSYDLQGYSYPEPSEYE